MAREVKQTKTKNGSTSSSVWKWKQVVTEYWETDPSHAEYYLTTNKSFVKVEGFLGRGDSASYFGGSAKTTFVCGGKTKENTKTYTYPTNVAANGWYSMYSYTFEMQHDPDGTKTIDVSTKMTTTAFNPNSASAKDTITLTAIPRKANLLSATNFTDEENPVITYENPLGEEVELLQAAITDSEGGVQYVRYRDIPKTEGEGTYEFELTDDERNTLRDAVGTSEWIYVAFYVKTVIGGTSYFSDLVRKVTLVAGIPEITATIKDVNPVTLALTGNNPDIFIKGHSNAEYTLDITAQKGAKLTGYTVDCGENYIISESLDNLEAATISNTIQSIDSPFLLVTATDNRGTTGYYSAPHELINYEDPLCSVRFISMSGVGELKFAVSGYWFNNKFGDDGVRNNIEVAWRYKEVDGEYCEWKVFPISVDDYYNTFEEGNYHITQTFDEGIDYKKKYIIQARIIDSLHPEGVLSLETASLAEPIFDWGAKDFNFNVDVEMQKNFFVNDRVMARYFSGTLVPHASSKSLMEPVNLNDWFEAGFYTVELGYDITLVSNAPEVAPFTLLVESGPFEYILDVDVFDISHNSCKQTFTTIDPENPKTWVRIWLNGVWGPWKRLYLDSDLYPVGAVETTSTMNGTQVSTAEDGTKQYTLPNRPGVWELFDKEFKPFNGEVSDALTLNTTNATSCKLFCMRSGHSMRLKYELVNKVAITDGTYNMLTTNFTALGLIDANLYYSYNAIYGGCDGANTIGMFNLTSTGELTSIDFNPKADGTASLAAGSTIFVDVTIPVMGTNMINSFCNKFYWKRVS